MKALRGERWSEAAQRNIASAGEGRAGGTWQLGGLLVGWLLAAAGVAVDWAVPEITHDVPSPRVLISLWKGS